MNTHVLISIKDIEDKIADLKKQIVVCQKNKEEENEIQIFIEIAIIQAFVRKGKQISLNEEDIKENIEEVEIIIMTQQQLLNTRFEDKIHLEKMKKVLKTLQILKDLL